MSISTKAILVVLNISGIPEPRRQDKKVRAQIAKRYKVEEKAVDFDKFLWNQEAPTYVALKQWGVRTREWHYARTVDFACDGQRFLKASEYIPYITKMTEFTDEGQDLFDAFINDLPHLKTQAKKALNGMFDEKLYPSEKKLRGRFGLEVTTFPVPDAGHVVLDLVTSEVTKAVKKSTEKAMKDATTLALKDAYTRLYEVTSNMAVALTDPERRFHDTLVTNVKEQCALMPALNITDDPELADIAEEVKKLLTKFAPETLREDQDKRAITAKRARELTEKMAAFCGR